MRQREEDDVVAGEHLEGGLLQDAVGQRHEVRLEAAERLPGVGGPGQGPDLHVGVREEVAQQLTSGVPAGSGDGDACPSHVHDYTKPCMDM